LLSQTGAAGRNAVCAAYNHAEHLAERRRMMQHWADYLDSLRDGADVVPICKGVKEDEQRYEDALCKPG